MPTMVVPEQVELQNQTAEVGTQRPILWENEPGSSTKHSALQQSRSTTTSLYHSHYMHIT